jgi:uncharacterized protein (TIGR00255 family)
MEDKVAYEKTKPKYKDKPKNQWNEKPKAKILKRKADSSEKTRETMFKSSHISKIMDFNLRVIILSLKKGIHVVYGHEILFTPQNSYLCANEMIMLLSMTGFGKTNGVQGTKKVSVEIRSLNSKSLDLTVKFSSPYKELESDIRKIIVEKLSRGKIDIGIYLESSAAGDSGSINTELAKQYFNDIRSLNEQMGNQPTDYLSLVLKMPDVVNYHSSEISDEEKKWVLNLVTDTCNSLTNFRKQEGEAIKLDLENRISAIRKDLLEIPKFESERIITVKERIQKGLKELENSSIDLNRLEQEMIFYIEKMDISEEKIRLANHLDYFIETMNLPFSGKKLGFIAQEIGREINTLGSKSNHTEMQKLVVEMKDNLEKIKEQVLNTL